MFKGVVRGIDKVGRVVIPREMMTMLNINKNDLVEVYGGHDEEGNPALMIRRYEPGCYLCGEELTNHTNYLEIGNKKLCLDCVDSVLEANRYKGHPNEE